MKKALVIVDMLNDFMDGTLPVPGADAIVENIGKIRGAAGEYGVAVIYANDAHSEDDPEFKAWPKHCVKGTYGAQVVDALKPAKTDLVIEKQDHSFFTNLETANLLSEREIGELYFTGVATEYCVKAAVIDAARRGYQINVVVDAVEGVDLQKGDQYGALMEMGSMGVRPVTTKKVLEELVK